MKHERKISGDGQIRSILVIDDHPLYAFALSSALGQVFDGCKVETATSLKEGMKCITSHFVPQLVMLDLRLPDSSGMSGFFRVRERLPDAQILIISALASSEIVQSLMDAGAAGFVPKDLSLSAIQMALKEVRAGKKYVPVGFREASHKRSPVQNDLETISRKIAELSPQQMRIMKLICAGKANKQIAYELSLAEATVKAHITALLRRLGVQNRTQAAVMIESASLEDDPFGNTPGPRACGEK